MNKLKRYSEFINESNENVDEIYDFIKSTIIPHAISFGFEESDIVGIRGEDDHWMEGGDLVLWNDNKKPTEGDWDKFWDYVKDAVYTGLYDDVIHDEWEGEGDVKKVFVDNLEGKVKDIFKEEYMKRVSKPEKPKKLKGDDLFQHILVTYVPTIEKENDMDDFSDEFEYYDNIITWAVDAYIQAEEPEKEDDWDYKDELNDGLKNHWQPI